MKRPQETSNVQTKCSRFVKKNFKNDRNIPHFKVIISIDHLLYVEVYITPLTAPINTGIGHPGSQGPVAFIKNAYIL